MSIGVRQRYVLCPLLCIVYVNDVNRHVQLGARNVHAYDMSVDYGRSTTPELKHNVQQCV